ncbi:unnamed protein product [Microthlaspi erraticum]|uniref:Reverse transcriptase zinc-binding domain-containing protein n=1 Tax=Microthlaspi erraticum TaxID=1685480 RepID=A0A6D2IND7_9BRAS|nr:unnamed protein product [Microthlaspi erraticum]
MLSFASRITMTKAVLSSFPVHTMSSIVLPQSTLARLDKISRSFVWGDTTKQKRQHLISWERVCLPKREGGLGIRKAQDMNKALIAKLSWRVLQDTNSLWSRVLRHKYKVTNIKDGLWSKRSGNWSSIWRSVRKGMSEVVIPGIHWVIEMDERFAFGMIKWLLDTPLYDLRTTEIPENLLEMPVRELWQNGAGWIMHQITPYLTENIRMQILIRFSVVRPH